MARKYKKCPYCAELVLAEAIKCRYCGEELPRTAASTEVNPTPFWKSKSILGLLAFLFMLVLYSQLFKKPLARDNQQSTQASEEDDKDALEVILDRAGVSLNKDSIRMVHEKLPFDARATFLSDLAITVDKANEEKTTKAPSTPSKHIHKAFLEPDRICNILADKGLDPNNPSTGSRWTYVSQAGYSCLAELEVTPGHYNYVGDVPNVIEFYVESKTAASVEKITFTANMFNQKKEEPVMQRFTVLVKLLFTRLDLSMPDGLVTAINAKKTETFSMEYGKVIVKYEKYNIGHGLTLEVTEQSAFQK